MNIPEGSFYYVLSFLFGGGLIWIIRVYLHQQKEILNNITSAVERLNEITARHDEKIKNINEKIPKIDRSDSQHELVMKQMMDTLGTMTRKLQDLQLVVEEKPRKYHNR